MQKDVVSFGGALAQLAQVAGQANVELDAGTNEAEISKVREPTPAVL